MQEVAKHSGDTVGRYGGTAAVHFHISVKEFIKAADQALYTKKTRAGT